MTPEAIRRSEPDRAEDMLSRAGLYYALTLLRVGSWVADEQEREKYGKSRLREIVGEGKP